MTDDSIARHVQQLVQATITRQNNIREKLSHAGFLQCPSYDDIQDIIRFQRHVDVNVLTAFVQFKGTAEYISIDKNHAAIQCALDTVIPWIRLRQAIGDDRSLLMHVTRHVLSRPKDNTSAAELSYLDFYDNDELD